MTLGTGGNTNKHDDGKLGYRLIHFDAICPKNKESKISWKKLEKKCQKLLEDMFIFLQQMNTKF